MKPTSLKPVKIQDHTAAGTSTITSDAVDMAGYTWATFLTSVGTAAANNTAKIQQSSDDGGADDYSDLEGTSITTGTSDEDIVVNVYKPTKRYLKIVCARGTSSTLESIWVIKGGARKQPITLSTSGTVVSESHATPSEGTA